MHYSRLVGLTMTALFLCPLNAPSVYAQESPTYSLSAKAGLLLPSSIYVDPPDVYYDTGVGVFSWFDADAFIGSHFSLGVAVIASALPLTEIDVSGSLLSAGLTFKGRFQIDQIGIKPGLLIAYQAIIADVIDVSNGLNLGAQVELTYGEASLKPAVQIGFVTQPTGGAECCEVLFSPIFYLSAGVVYSN